mmetsp:Transcript_245/g.525  ORF Transcript_245/g.525 Transcript_245/m.525 type:complete len:270 (+) Transcript_245:78-887(+)
MMGRTSFILAMGAVLFASVDARSGSTLREQKTLRTGDQGPRHFLISTDLGNTKQKLRVCSAFGNESPLDITLVRTNELLGSLKYKDCVDYKLQLKTGDQLDFKADGAAVGTFAVAGMPQASQMLLLVVQNREGLPGSAAFKSHAFAEEKPDSAQVAIIDAYSGTKKAEKVQIYDATEPNITLGENAALPLNSVTLLKPGSYEVALNTAGQNLTSAELSAEGNYVVLRVGEGSPAMPEELVVFPQTGGAGSAAVLGSGLLLAAFLHLFLV